MKVSIYVKLPYHGAQIHHACTCLILDVHLNLPRRPVLSDKPGPQKHAHFQSTTIIPCNKGIRGPSTGKHHAVIAFACKCLILERGSTYSSTGTENNV